MCFDICTINTRVSIRVRGLHLVFNPESDHGSMFGFGRALWQLRRMIYG